MTAATGKDASNKDAGGVQAVDDSAIKGLQDRALNGTRLFAGESERLVECHTGLGDDARRSAAVRPGRSMDEEGVTHENVAGAARRKCGGALKRVALQLVRQGNEVQAVVAERREQRRDVEVRADLQLCRRVCGGNVREQEEAQQSARLACDVEVQAFRSVIAPIDMPTGIPGIG